MKTRFRSCFVSVLTLALLMVASLAQAEENPVGQFTSHADIGAPKNAGNAAYNPVSQEYLLTASGFNMWAARDEFQFVWKKMKGNFIVRARGEFIGTGTDPHRKYGWIARPSLDADSPYADCAIHGEGLTSLQFRKTKGAITEQVPMFVKAPDVFQLERRGNIFVFSAAKYGESFTNAQTAELPLGDELYVGLFLCSHNSNVVEQALFRDVRLIRPAKDDFVPYRDYIGSVLELLEVDSGRLQSLYSSPLPFEAPNWTRDGAALIYNTSGKPDNRGKLIRFDLATHATKRIETGLANRSNNDHVLSFDGTMLGISDQSTNHGGQSAVFTVSVNGGEPKRITPLTPSYMHSWSPDGKSLIYTGGRSNEFEIYQRASDGSGEELNLTNSKGLDDGAEYTPDGKYIYFNSVRSGTMQIWRMKADGKDPEQITNDEYNNWFPHISPDGRKIVIISFPKEVPPGEHPYYKRVYLRLLPIEGGAPKVIAYVYGGQGTINVPSWSPDSRMIAFVSNTDME